MCTRAAARALAFSGNTSPSSYIGSGDSLPALSRPMLHCSDLAVGRYLKVNRSFLFALEAHGAVPPGHDVIGNLCRSISMEDTEDTIRLVSNGRTSLAELHGDGVLLALYPRGNETERLAHCCGQIEII